MRTFHADDMDRAYEDGLQEGQRIEGVALDALRKIDAEAPEAPPAYQDWGGDTEQAESWGINAGLYRAATIARKAIARIEGHAKVEGEG